MSFSILLSPAKLNLYLKVVSKRDDGYHNINSLVQKISLFDTIKIKIFNNKLINEIKFYNINIPEKNNTIFKTINFFKEYTNINFGYKIYIYKKIPIEAGLGGGSSNAAIVLKFLNNFFKTKLTLNDLIKIGAKIGADVPLFLCNDSLILIYGIGDKVKPIHTLDLPYKWFLLVKPNISLSTKKVYSNLNFILTNFNKNIMEDTLLEIGHNDLEYSAFKLEPRLKEIKEFLKNYSDLCLLTGSGSTIYCGFKLKADILAVYKKVLKKYKNFQILIVRAL